VSALDADGQPFRAPETDRALFDTLREHLNDAVEVVEVDEHINDAAFADAFAERLLGLLGPR
jgi:uncharacterized protein (UPF0261 family)